MSLFTLPTATEVLTDSGLRPEQLKAGWDATAAETNITAKIAEQAGRGETRLLKAATPLAWPFTDAQVQAAYPSYSSGQRTDYIARQATQATLATKLLTLFSVYRLAGQLNKRYDEKADEFKADAEAILAGDGDSDAGLLGTIAWVAEQQPGDTAPEELKRRSSSVTQVQVWA